MTDQAEALRAALHVDCQPTERCGLPRGYADRVIDAFAALAPATAGAEPPCDCECHLPGSDMAPSECDGCTGTSEQERVAARLTKPEEKE